MSLIARKDKFVCALLTMMLSGSFFTAVVFADDEPKTVPTGDEERKKLDTTDTETVAQYGLAATGHRFNELISVRPEVRYEYAFGARPWDNSTRKGQLMFAMDAISRF
jgi:hypothetical protein